MGTHSFMNPGGPDPFITVRMPGPFRDQAIEYLRQTGIPACEGALAALFQKAIDDYFGGLPDNEPPALDPGGGMRSPDEIEDAARDEGDVVLC